MATLAINVSEIEAAIGQQLGISRDSGDWDTQTQADVDRMIRHGKRNFFHPPIVPPDIVAHKWSFLEQVFNLTTTAPFEDSTVTVAAGVVTLAAGSWPASPIPEDSFLELDGQLYEVASRDSGSQLTLVNTGVTETAATSYSLYRYRHPMPTDFESFLEPLVASQQQNFTEPVLTSGSEFDIRALYASYFEVGRPRRYSVFSIPEDSDDSGTENGVPQYMMMLWPLPDAVYELKSKYRIQPGDGLDSGDSGLLNANPMFSEAMMASILAAAERIDTDKPDGPQQREYLRVLQAAISHDRQASGMRGHFMPKQTRLHPVDTTLLNAPITYDSASP